MTLPPLSVKSSNLRGKNCSEWLGGSWDPSSLRKFLSFSKTHQYFCILGTMPQSPDVTGQTQGETALPPVGL